MFNGLAINPGYAGSHEALSVTALSRNQWVNIPGAPNTQTLSVHSPLGNERAALGGIFIRDKIGVTTRNSFYGSYAYRLYLGNGGTLSLGLQGGFTNYDAGLTELNIHNGLDPNFTSNDETSFLPNFGFGAYYYTDMFYLGFSVPEMIQNSYDSDDVNSSAKQYNHYFFTTGVVVPLNASLKLKPNLLIKAVAGAPMELDLNLNLLIKETLWVGASWRSFDSFDALLQLQVSDKIQIGYAYDFATTTDLRSLNGGSHEFLINYRMSYNKNKVVSPRYF
jgi:type IX secretion system PorP/SprF family membrane protein